MLAKAYRLVCENQSGGVISAVSGNITPWKFDANGALEYQTRQAQAWGTPPTDGNATPADAAIDNATTLALGGHGYVTVTTAGSGFTYFYLQQSDDGGTTWASTYTNPVATVEGSGSAEFEI